MWEGGYLSNQVLEALRSGVLRWAVSLGQEEEFTLFAQKEVRHSNISWGKLGDRRLSHLTDAWLWE